MSECETGGLVEASVEQRPNAFRDTAAIATHYYGYDFKCTKMGNLRMLADIEQMNLEVIGHTYGRSPRKARQIDNSGNPFWSQVCEDVHRDQATIAPSGHHIRTSGFS